MAGFENLVRSALAKRPNASTQERGQVYASARQVLEKMIASKPEIDAHMAADQRRKLEFAISRVEDEFAEKRRAELAASRAEAASQTASAPAPAATSPSDQASSPPAAPAEPSIVAEPQTPNVAAPVAHLANPVEAPLVDPVAYDTAAPDPVGMAEPLAPEAVSPVDASVDPGLSTADGQAAAPAAYEELSFRDAVAQYERPPEAVLIDEAYAPAEEDERPRRRIFSRILLAAIVIATVGIAGWWAYSTFVAPSEEANGGSVPNPPVERAEEDFSPAEPLKVEDGWTIIFDGQDLRTLVSQGPGAVTQQQETQFSFVRISSAEGTTTGNTVNAEIPPGTLIELSGKRVTFEIAARSGGAGSLEFVVSCLIGGQSACGRKRFTAEVQVEPYLFDVVIPESSGIDSANAYLSIQSDLGGTGLPLDLLSVKVKPQDE
ncbi:MAG: hypothetical protein AAF468_10565 [Pseudomonadota bacterium]